jgi:thiamine-phosphate pyrophosphorylase
VIDRTIARQPLEVTLEGAVAGGVDWIQIRERDLDTGALLALAEEVRAAARRGAPSRTVCVIVNRRIDLALALPAEGVHLGFDALAADEARGLLGEHALIGVSAHSPEELAEVAAAGASYAHLAPLYAPLSKQSTRTPLGLPAISEAARYGVPILAQGGITAARCPEVLAAGAAGVAVTGSILAARDPAEAAGELRRALDAGAC